MLDMTLTDTTTGSGAKEKPPIPTGGSSPKQTANKGGTMTTITQNKCSVNPPQYPTPSTLNPQPSTLNPERVAHQIKTNYYYKRYIYNHINNNSNTNSIINHKREGLFGVPQLPAIPIEWLLKHHQHILAALTTELQLHPQEAAAVFALLRYQAWYRSVYPSAAQVAHQGSVSRRTFWRAISWLGGLGIIDVINCYHGGEHSQMSNAYDLQRLIRCLVAYLARFLRRFPSRIAALYTRDIYLPWDHFLASLGLVLSP